MTATPASTAGTVGTDDQRQPQRLEVGCQQQEDDDHGQTSQSAPDRRQAAEHLLHRHHLAAHVHLARRAAASPAASRSPGRAGSATRPRSSPSMLAVMLTSAAHVVAVVLARHGALA